MATPEMAGRMGPYEPNKDPFGGMRKGNHNNNSNAPRNSSWVETFLPSWRMELDTRGAVVLNFI